MDEIHFFVCCKLYGKKNRDIIFYQKVARINSNFVDFADHEKYIFLMKPADPYILMQFGKYVFKLFNIRTKGSMMLYEQNGDVSSICYDESLGQFNKTTMITTCSFQIAS